MIRDERSRSHTKKGPGRYHGQGAMITIRPLLTDIRIVKPAQRRFPIAQRGGNWQGLEYLTMAEHDRIQSFRLDCRAKGIEVSYDAARSRYLEERRATPAPTSERLVTIPLEA